MFEAILHRFWYHFWSFFGVIFWCFPNSAKNATHHENVLNSGQIVGRAAMETRKIRYKINEKLDRKPHRNFDDFLMVLVVIFWSFWKILEFKSRSKFDHDFWMLFCRITGRDVASTDRRRIVGAPATAVPVPRILPRRRPFPRAEGSYKRLGSQAPRPKPRKRDPTRHGPEAWPI